MQAERAPKPRTITPSTPNTTPQSIKARYADATLLNVCDELRSTLQGVRFNTLRRVSLVVGSVCAACGTGTTEAARQLEAATSDWADPAKVKATIANGLAKGETNPAVIDWKHDASETFGQAAELVLQWLQASKWAGVQVCQRGNVSRASVQTIATAMAEYSQSKRLYGAFALSVRSLRQLTGFALQTIHNSLNALCTDGILSIVGRDEYQFIKAHGKNDAAGDKRLQARVYVFNLAEIGRQIAQAGSTTRTVIVHSGKGKVCESYEPYLSEPITVLVVRGDTFSKLALGRSAAAVLSKLLAAPEGLDDAALAELTGLHVDTVGRAIGRLLLHGLVDCKGDKTLAVDADAIRAALVAVADEYELKARREIRETIIRAERAAHGAYVQARRSGTGEADAQRLYRHVYNEIKHPGAALDKVSELGKVFSAQPAAPLPTPGDYPNVWEQHIAAAKDRHSAFNYSSTAIQLCELQHTSR